MTRTYCDRCGVDITGEAIKSGKAPIFNIEYGWSITCEQLDLCQECNDKLYDWLNEMKRGDKNNG